MSDKVKKFHDALDDVLDRPIAYNPAFKRITASTVAGIFLSQAWYWSKRHKEDDGWSYKTGKEWEEETGLTRSEQETARKHCLRVGVIEEKLKGIPATMYYRVVKPQVYTLLGLEFVDIQQTGQNEGNQQSDGYSNINNESETPPMIPPSDGSGLSEEEKRQANAKVTAMIENAKKMKYVNRDKLEFSEDYLRYADIYVELIGKDPDGQYIQVPTKRVLHDWIATFEEWKQERLTADHLRAAYQHANRPEGGFPVGRPGALTNTAVAMKSKILKTNASPAVNEAAVEETKELVERKFSGEFVPRPGSMPSPDDVKRKMREAAQRKGNRS